MKIIETRAELLNYMNEIDHSKLGLVPTMGNLHAGHMSLLKDSLEACELTVITIFINPKQFGKNEDLATYPRTPQEDIELIKETVGQKQDSVIAFIPSSLEEIYPEGFDTTISLGAITKKLCGLSRPGHFDGVTTVVYQLFTLVKPALAFFGQKDYQQVAVIKKMVIDLNLSLEIRTTQIVRDESGLALSSRNNYLSDAQKEEALVLRRTIQSISDVLRTGAWVESQSEINNILEDTLKDSSWDYLEILDAQNLEDISMTTTSVVIAGAYFIGSRPTRLIDNQLVDIIYA